MQKIVLASGNAGKLKEIGAILAPLQIKLVPQSEYALESADETGLTFVENAILKARHVAQATGLPALADDSGLTVDALGGAPGIYSARYAGADASDADNNSKLLQALADVPEHARGASFHCVLVLLRDARDPTPLIAQGIWEGRILSAPRGDNGFGYDPLFFCPRLQASSAELTPDIKNKFSHRARALAQLSQLISPYLIAHRQ